MRSNDALSAIINSSTCVGPYETGNNRIVTRFRLGGRHGHVPQCLTLKIEPKRLLRGGGGNFSRSLSTFARSIAFYGAPVGNLLLRPHWVLRCWPGQTSWTFLLPGMLFTGFVLFSFSICSCSVLVALPVDSFPIACATMECFHWWLSGGSRICQGGHGERPERELITGVWGQSSPAGFNAVAEPLVGVRWSWKLFVQFYTKRGKKLSI